MRAEQRHGITILTLDVDHLDSSNFTTFKSEVDEHASDARRVILDMHSLRFVDSAGLGSILSVLRRLGERGGTLKIVGVTRPVQQLFGLVRLPRIIDMYSTVEEAVEAYRT